MSCYEWESGEVKIPSSEWASFKKRVRDAYNAEQERMFNEALKHYEMIVKQAKGKRGFDRISWYESYVYNGSGKYNFLYELFPYKDGKRTTKPVKPKKNSFAKLKTTDTHISGRNCEIEFDNRTKTVHWTVHENNRAVENARSSTIGSAFFSALRSIKWTSKTGGVFVGNDEYNKDSDDIGGGGNYITAEFGGIGERLRKQSIRYY